MSTNSDRYVSMFEHSYEVEQKLKPFRQSRLAYLSDHIFGFVTDDDEKGVLFARKALEVCAAISDRTTYEYISNDENYTWFLLMCNMPFFSSKIACGCSIRGSWWDSLDKFEIKSCGLWSGEDQLLFLSFDLKDWMSFVSAMIEFSNNGIKQ